MPVRESTKMTLLPRARALRLSYSNTSWSKDKRHFVSQAHPCCSCNQYLSSVQYLTLARASDRIKMAIDGKRMNQNVSLGWLCVETATFGGKNVKILVDHQRLHRFCAKKKKNQSMLFHHSDLLGWSLTITKQDHTQYQPYPDHCLSLAWT